MLNKKILAAAAAVSALTMGAPASAQQTGLINVDLSNLLANAQILNDLDLLNNSLNNNTVQIPIGLAVAICDINANVLAKQRKEGNSTCMARNVTTALKSAVKKQSVPKAQ